MNINDPKSRLTTGHERIPFYGSHISILYHEEHPDGVGGGALRVLGGAGVSPGGGRLRAARAGCGGRLLGLRGWGVREAE